MISIIVPVYNSAKNGKLSHLIESILNQEYKNFELLLIDDGSTDNSLQICEQFSRHDNRVKVFHKANGGVSSARNYGIEKSLGEFLFFADDDDYVYPDFLKTMAKEIGNYDLLITLYLETNENVRTEQINRNSVVTERTEANNKNEIREKITELKLARFATIWINLFRKDIIVKNNIRFKDIKSEDEIFVNEYLLHCNSIKRIDYQGYLFIHRKDSQGSSHSYIANLDFLKLIDKLNTDIFKYLKLGDTSSDQNFKRIRLRNENSRLISFLLKGYHIDTRIPYKQRMENWEDASRTNLSIYEIREKSPSFKVFFYICRFKLYYILDPILLCLVRLRDFKISR